MPHRLDQTYWKILGNKPIPNPASQGKTWEVQCHNCGDVNLRTSAQINRNVPKCRSPSCSNALDQITLEFRGSSKTLSAWFNLYPEIVKTKVRDYSSRRNLGRMPWASYTDAQVLFGKSGLPRHKDALELDAESRRKLSQAANDFCLQVAHKIQFSALEASRDSLMKLLESTLKEPSKPQLAGGNYELPVGSTIQDLYDVDMIDDIRMWLKEELFETIQDKEDALHPYIPVDVSHRYITELEIMALLSIIDMEY